MAALPVFPLMKVIDFDTLWRFLLFHEVVVSDRRFHEASLRAKLPHLGYLANYYWSPANWYHGLEFLGWTVVSLVIPSVAVVESHRDILHLHRHTKMEAEQPVRDEWPDQRLGKRNPMENASFHLQEAAVFDGIHP